MCKQYSAYVALFRSKYLASGMRSGAERQIEEKVPVMSLIMYLVEVAGSLPYISSQPNENLLHAPACSSSDRHSLQAV